MRLTDYLPHGPSMSAPPIGRVRAVLAARHKLSWMGFALVICTLFSLTSAVPAFGHDILAIRKGDSIHFTGNPFDKETETENWENYEYWREFIAELTDNMHWHFDIAVNHIDGWESCLVEAYYYDEDNRETDEGDYNLSGGNCPGGTSTDGTPQNNPNNPPQFNGSTTATVPENTPTTQKLVMVKATDSDSEDGPVTITLGGADGSHFSLSPSPGVPLERDLKFTIVPDYENPQDANGDNVYVVVVTATSGTGDRERTTTKTITITVTDVNEPPDTPNEPSVSADSETSLRVTWTAPGNGGGPPITGYNYRRKKTSDPDSPGNWTQGTASGLSVTISSLEEGISYDVQIQAKNDEERAAGRLREPVRQKPMRHRRSPAQRRRACRKTRHPC